MHSDKYKTISGDTWDIIAYKVYGECIYMDRLIEANIPYADTVIFSAGIELSIPEITTEAANTLPPWKR